VLFAIFIINHSPGENLRVSISKNAIQLSQTDSIIYQFYLNSPAKTTIKFINIFGGEEIIYEKDKNRTSGWHEIILHSDSLKASEVNYSSGLYYLELRGNYNNGQPIKFNSFQLPWGELIITENIELNKKEGIISYDLPKFSMTRVRVGMKDGALIRSFNWEPQIEGKVIKVWDGFDQTGKVKVTDKLDLTSRVVAYGLPETAFLLNNKNNPIDFNSDAFYPEEWNKFAALEVAKKPWNESLDLALDFDISIDSKESFTVTFPETLKKNKVFNKIFLAENEIYISIDDLFYIENQNIDVAKSYTISVPELEDGTRLFITNLIFGIDNDPYGSVAAGIKEIIIE